MKTFKMMSFSLLEAEGKTDFPIIDGLVINQENSFQTWVLELFLSKQYHSIFESLHASGNVFEANVIISFPDNDPAKFTLVVNGIKEINDNISVLMQGKIINPTRKKEADVLLDELAKLNISEDEIVAQLNKRRSGESV